MTEKLKASILPINNDGITAMHLETLIISVPLSENLMLMNIFIFLLQCFKINEYSYLSLAKQ